LISSHDSCPTVQRRADDEGIVGGDRVVPLRVAGEVVGADVDADHLAEKRQGVLAAPIGIVAGSAIAGREIQQVAVGPEAEPPALVEVMRLRDLEDELLRVHVGDVGVGRHAKTRDKHVARRIGVEDVEGTAGLEVRGKLDAEDTGRETGGDRAHLKERLGLKDAVLDQPDPPCGGVIPLLDDENAVQVARGRGHIDRLGDLVGGQGEMEGVTRCADSQHRRESRDHQELCQSAPRT
jgi:hypothetical protein